MDFLLIAYFEAGQIFYETVPSAEFQRLRSAMVRVLS